MLEDFFPDDWLVLGLSIHSTYFKLDVSRLARLLGNIGLYSWANDS